MATLHVRNVPDELYEQLRDCATANGRSIGAEVIVLIERRIVEDLGQQRRIQRRGPRRRRPSTPFQHFGPAARQAIVSAREEAAALGARGIGTEHLLIAVLQGPPNPLTPLVERSGLDYATARAVVEAASDPASDPASEPASEPAAGPEIPFTPDAKQAMELALRDSLSLGADFIGPEHLLLGISRVNESLGGRILAGAPRFLQWPMLHRELLMASGQTSVRGAAPTPRAPSRGFRVVELDGPAEEWERVLNSHAAKGHQLVEIVEKRAIFKVPLQ